MQNTIRIPQVHAMTTAELTIIQAKQGVVTGATDTLVAQALRAEEIHERRIAAIIWYAAGKLQAQLGDLRGAQHSFANAADLCERMGMRTELEQVQQDQERLADQATSLQQE